jgi:hypothetical protein
MERAGWGGLCAGLAGQPHLDNWRLLQELAGII